MFLLGRFYRTLSPIFPFVTFLRQVADEDRPETDLSATLKRRKSSRIGATQACVSSRVPGGAPQDGTSLDVQAIFQKAFIIRKTVVSSSSSDESDNESQRWNPDEWLRSSPH